MNQVTERANAIIKIRKLQSQTIEGGCTESQVEIAMRKISELLETFDLTMDEVSLAAQECKLVQIDTKSKKGPPLNALVVRLAEFCDCLAYRSGGRSSSIKYCFYGMEQDVDMVQYLYEMILKALEGELENFKKTETYRNYPTHRRALSNSFIVGFNTRMNTRLREIKKERENNRFERENALRKDGFEVDTKPNVLSTGTSLIELKTKKVETDFKEKYGWTVRYSYSSRRGPSDYNGYYAGQKAASGVSLNRPVGNGGNHSGVRQIGFGG